MGFRGKISQNALADANEKRTSEIYRDFAYVLIQMPRNLYSGDDFGLELEQTVYASFPQPILPLFISKILNLGQPPAKKSGIYRKQLTQLRSAADVWTSALWGIVVAFVGTPLVCICIYFVSFGESCFA